MIHDIDAFLKCEVDGGLDLLELLSSKQAVLAAMRVQAGDGDLRIFNAHVAAGLVRDLDALQDTGRLDAVTGLAKRDMGAHMHNAEIVMGQLYRRQGPY